MIAVAILLILVGFALIAPTNDGSRSTMPRSLAIGWWRMPPSEGRGYDGTPPRRARLIRALVGLAMLIGGVVIVATL